MLSRRLKTTGYMGGAVGFSLPRLPLTLSCTSAFQRSLLPSLFTPLFSPCFTS